MVVTIKENMLSKIKYFSLSDILISNNALYRSIDVREFECELYNLHFVSSQRLIMDHKERVRFTDRTFQQIVYFDTE